VIRAYVARRPLASFLVIGIGAYFAVAAMPWLTETDLPWFEQPLDGVVGGILGVGLAAFLVTAAADGRPGVVDLARRTFRWRVHVGWYALALLYVPLTVTVLAFVFYQGEVLETPPEGWLHVIGAVCALFVLQSVLFQFAEEVGWTGFFQDRLRDRYGPIALSFVVAVPWALWHVPDYFASEGWSLETLIGSLVYFVIEVVLLFFARVVIVWLYEQTGRSVLLVIVFHASFDATISRLAEDLIPGSNAVRFLLATAVIVAAAVAIMVAVRRRPGVIALPARPAPST
jgi:uncharacterized protein